MRGKLGLALFAVGLGGMVASIVGMIVWLCAQELYLLGAFIGSLVLVFVGLMIAALS